MATPALSVTARARMAGSSRQSRVSIAEYFYRGIGNGLSRFKLRHPYQGVKMPDLDMHLKGRYLGKKPALPEMLGHGRRLESTRPWTTPDCLASMSRTCRGIRKAMSSAGGT